MSEDKQGKIRFDYIKSTNYRVAHADGAWGGATPQGGIFVAIYSERPSIPQRIVHHFSEAGLGEEVKDERVDRSAVIREVEVGLTMTLPVARVIHEWLGKHIAQVEALVAAAQQQQTPAAEQSNAEERK